MSKDVLFDYTSADFVDSDHCGSSLRCQVSVTKGTSRHGGASVNAFVEFRDCDRKIEWSGWGDDGILRMRKKIGVAQRRLQQMQDALDEAEKIFSPRRRAYLKAKKKRDAAG